MEWLYIKNIQHLSEVKLDHETKKTLLTHYEAFYKEEKRIRSIMEKSLQD